MKCFVDTLSCTNVGCQLPVLRVIKGHAPLRMITIPDKSHREVVNKGRQS